MPGALASISSLLLRALGERRLKHEYFFTGLTALDELLPSGGFARGAVHEVIVESNPFSPMAFLILLAGSAFEEAKSVVWLDPLGEMYPPGFVSAGLSIKDVLLLRPNSRDAVRVVTECCQCKGVAATIAPLSRLSQVEARRLQLAAERGGGICVLIRPKKSATCYSAATRWIVSPQRGDKTFRRWQVQLIHGHGGRVGQTAILEVNRETNRMRAFEAVADRPIPAEAFSISA